MVDSDEYRITAVAGQPRRESAPVQVVTRGDGLPEQGNQSLSFVGPLHDPPALDVGVKVRTPPKIAVYPLIDAPTLSHDDKLSPLDGRQRHVVLAKIAGQVLQRQALLPASQSCRSVAARSGSIKAASAMTTSRLRTGIPVATIAPQCRR